MTHSEFRSDTLPATVRDFLTAGTVHDADTASSFLVQDVVIVDQNETFRGRDEAHAFLRDAGTEFEYTTEQTGARRVDDDHWVVTLRLDGDIAAPLGWAVTLLGVAGLVAAVGLVRRAPWAPWAVAAVAALNVAGALVALVSDREGALIGLTVSLCGLLLATACLRTTVRQAPA